MRPFHLPCLISLRSSSSGSRARLHFRTAAQQDARQADHCSRSHIPALRQKLNNILDYCGPLLYSLRYSAKSAAANLSLTSLLTPMLRIFCLLRLQRSSDQTHALHFLSERTSPTTLHFPPLVSLTDLFLSPVQIHSGPMLKTTTLALTT